MSASQFGGKSKFILGICPQTTDFNKTTRPDFRFILNVLGTKDTDANQTDLLWSQANVICDLITQGTGHHERGNSEIALALRNMDSEALLQSYSRVLKETCQLLLDSGHPAARQVDSIYLYKDMQHRTDKLHTSPSIVAEANKKFDSLGGYYPQYSTSGSDQRVEKLQASSTVSSGSIGAGDRVMENEHDLLVDLSSLSLSPHGQRSS